MDYLGFTLEDLKCHEQLGYISRVPHPEDHEVSLYNYTKKTVNQRHWNRVTMACRGLILHERTGEVLAKPFPKFFGINEPLQSVKTAQDKTPLYGIKYDGSLGILYRRDGKIKWATRGSFTSEQSQEADRLWSNHYQGALIPDEVTVLAEIISPKTKVIVDYKEKEQLVVIGAYNRFTGEEYLYEQLMEWGKRWGMPVVELYEGDVEALLLSTSHALEGVVAWWPGEDLRVKYKTNGYLNHHRMHNKLDKTIIQSWAAGGIESVLERLPEEFHEEAERKVVYINHNLYDLCERAEMLFSSVGNTEDRKVYKKAIQHLDPLMKRLMFALLDGKELAPIIRKHFHHHYKQMVFPFEQEG
ncbi:hypothetical protein IMZ31_22870 (plasmid) [Pontibacillus sp. ALD_SL1]|uniref:RNA ligase n=1 Tax=Pontibacillus sp. ALD_SL1 TaxID=2777185 RepID=UPI001A971C91|nr:RNA ligase [Pontibacillus sp. ALD_SL1]QST02299.1 hypothetical protein IMZ31_22870 [Pontibacillus sp. ALD_SL1]